MLIGWFETLQAGYGADRLHRDQIGGAEDRLAVTLRRVDSLKSAVRNGTADKSNILHTREAQVRDKLTTTTHQPIIFLTQKTRANTLTRHSPSLQSYRAFLSS